MSTRPDTLRAEGMTRVENNADPRVLLAIDAVIDRHIGNRPPVVSERHPRRAACLPRQPRRRQGQGSSIPEAPPSGACRVRAVHAPLHPRAPHQCVAGHRGGGGRMSERPTCPDCGSADIHKCMFEGPVCLDCGWEADA